MIHNSRNDWLAKHDKSDMILLATLHALYDLHTLQSMALAYLDSDILASPSLEGGSPPLSTSESLESLHGWREEEIGSMAGRKDKPTAYVHFIPRHLTMHMIQTGLRFS